MDSPGEGFEYKAFISYSHSDIQWARWLLNALETYRLPAAIRQEIGRKQGVGRVFRDRDEASAAADLKAEIQRALLASEHLIVIASPRSAKSAYVQAEIEAFAEASRKRAVPGHILTLIVDGEPNAGDATLECFAPVLRGGLRKADGTAFEPLAADARPTGDGKTRALAKLVSGLLNIRYDTLVRRDLQRRARLYWIGALTGLAAVATAAIVGWIIVDGSRQRDAALRDNRTVTAVGNAERARRLLESGNIKGAVELARPGLATDETLPFIPQAYSVLYDALFRESRLTADLGDRFEAITLPLPGQRYLTWTPLDGIVIWSLNGGVLYRRLAPAELENPALSEDGRYVYFTPGSAFGGALSRYDGETDHWSDIDLGLAGFDLGSPTQMLVVGEDIVGCTSGLTRFELASDTSVETTAKWHVPLDDCTAIARSETGTILIGTWHGEVIEFDAETGAEIRRYALDDAKLWVHLIRANARHLIAASLDRTVVLPRDGGPPVLVLDDDAAISPSGRYLAEFKSHLNANEEDGTFLHDVEAGTKTAVGCHCPPVGFIDDNTLLVADTPELKAIDLASGAQRTIMPLDSGDSAYYLPRDNLVVTLGFGLDTVVSLDAFSEAMDNLLIDEPLETSRLVAETDFLTDHDVVVAVVIRDQPREYQRWQIGPDGKGTRIGDAQADDFDNSNYGHQPEEIPAAPEIAAGTPTPDELAGATLRWNPEAVVLVAADGRYLAHFTREGSPFASAAYIPERGLVVAGTESGEIRVWSATSPVAPMIELRKHAQAVTMLDANPSASAFLSADWYRNIRIWPLLSNDELLAKLAQRFPAPGE